jgi:hypothetical protein
MAKNFNLIHKASNLFRNNDSPLSDILKNSDPSPDTPLGIPLPTSPPKDIPRNILAFRTITKLLSHIQQEQPFQVSWDKPPPADKEELSLSTAFATIAVIDHEIVAVATRHNCEKVEVILAPQTSIKDASTDRSSWLKRGFEFFVAKNPRLKDPPSTTTDEPTISDADTAGIVPGINLDDDEILKQWVDEYW